MKHHCVKFVPIFFSVLVALVISSSKTAMAESGIHTYQVTGPVLEANENRIIIQKGDEKWEIARSRTTKVTGTVKPGAKVTVQYKMTATAIEQLK